MSLENAKTWYKLQFVATESKKKWFLSFFRKSKIFIFWGHKMNAFCAVWWVWDELFRWALKKIPYRKSSHNVKHFLYLSCVLTMNSFQDTPPGCQIVLKLTILSVYSRKLFYIGVKTLVFETAWEPRGVSWKLLYSS